MSGPEEIARILTMLQALRIGVQSREFDLQREIAQALARAGIPYRREVPLGAGARADLLAEGGILIEVKKGRPRAPEVMEQLRRYARSPQIRVIILVVEAHCPCPAEINGRPVMVVNLRKQWGIAI